MKKNENAILKIKLQFHFLLTASAFAVIIFINYGI